MTVMQIPQIADALAAMPARFHLEVGPHQGATSLATLCDDPLLLSRWIADDGGVVGAPNLQVAASMLVQHIAMVLGGATMAAALLHDALPIADSHAVSVVQRPKGTAMTRFRFFMEPVTVETGSPSELLQRWGEVWMGDVLSPLVDAVHHTVRVGRRMLEDNVRSAAAANLVFLDWWRPQAHFSRLTPVLEHFSHPSTSSSIEFSTIEHAGRVGLRSYRRSCCLHFQCDPPHWCPTCPRLDEEGREQIMRAHLGHLDAVLAQRTQEEPYVHTR
jgi:ferric iron reductase protein FhuF